MDQEKITNSELELMCQDICFGLGTNQYEELGLEVSGYCDLITTYKDENFKISQRNPCDGGYFLEAYYNGKKVLSSNTKEILENISSSLRREDDKENIMIIFGVREEEADAIRKSMDFSDIMGCTNYQDIQVDKINPVWIDKLEKLHTLNWENIRKKLVIDVSYLTQLELPLEIKSQQHLNL